MTFEEIQQRLEPYESYRKPERKQREQTGQWAVPGKVDMLKRLWNEGLSASEIAARVGGVTRNAVIGKAHRLGLSGRITPNRKPSKPRKPRERKPHTGSISTNEKRSNTQLGVALARSISKPPIPPAEPLSPITEIDVPLYARKQLLERTAHEDRTLCHWIIGDPKTPDHHYCHHHRTPGSSYCAHHARTALRKDDMVRNPKGTTVRIGGLLLRTFAVETRESLRELIDDKAA